MRFYLKMKNGEEENLKENKAKFWVKFIDRLRLLDLGAIGPKFSYPTSPSSCNFNNC